MEKNPILHGSKTHFALKKHANNPKSAKELHVLFYFLPEQSNWLP